MDSSSDIALWLILWIGVAAITVFGRLKRASQGTGLALAYVLNLWLIHWVAPSLYLLPGYAYYDVNLVRLGFEQSTFGILAFAFGSLVLAPFLIKLHRPRNIEPVSYEVHEKLPVAYMLIGAVSYVLLSSLAGPV